MAPIRRYLRITQYSVLEVRIYLDNPALAEPWLLHPRHPVLPRIIAAVRPLVLPKLQEENTRERSRAKGKRKGVKDVVVEDDFEVSIFLTATSTRHALLTKQRHVREKHGGGLKSNAHRLTGAGESSAEAIQVEDGGDMQAIVPEESDDEMLALSDIPTMEEETEVGQGTRRRSKRRRAENSEGPGDESGLFVDEDEDEDGEDDGQEMELLRPNRTKATLVSDDKKKLALDTSYDGFAIYGRVLCLIIKKRDSTRTTSKAMLEDWITATQLPTADDDS